jgi:hypothetical protein
MVSEETRLKMSAAAKKRTESPEARSKLGDARRGKPHSVETKLKMHETRMGHSVSNETRIKIGNSKRGVVVSEATRKKQSVALMGKKPYNFGKPHSEETKRKQSEVKRGDKNWWYGKHRSQETILKTSGKNHHCWKGGVSFEPYCIKFNNIRKRAVRKFFDNRCIVCGSHSREFIRIHAVHHIDHDKEQGCNGKPFNLVPLCQSCHMKELYHEQEYKSYINHTLEEGFKWGIWNREQYELEVMYPEQSEVEMMITEKAMLIPAGV